MYVKLEPFSWNIYGETIGGAWLSANSGNNLTIILAVTAVNDF